ncbi:MAG: DMT family transporter [Alphaproteobacteria bacterium]|nr:DMT family transporter [Alphaproteobacteria bacterium]
MRLAPLGFILLWSSSFLTARVGLAVVSPLLFVALRLVAAAALMTLLALALRQSFRPLKHRWPRLAVAGALVNGVTLAAFHVGMVTVETAVMALVQAMNPLVIALLAMPLLGERLRPLQWLGLACGACGVVLVVAERAWQSPAQLAAIALGGAGLAGLSCGTIYFGRHGRGLPLLPATAVQLATGALLVLVLMMLFEAPRATWGVPALATIAWNVLAVSIGGMALYYAMLNRGTAGRVAANFYLVPGIVALLGWWLLGESLSPLALLGFAVASAGVFLVVRHQAAASP